MAYILTHIYLSLLCLYFVLVFILSFPSVPLYRLQYIYLLSSISVY